MAIHTPSAVPVSSSEVSEDWHEDIYHIGKLGTGGNFGELLQISLPI